MPLTAGSWRQKVVKGKFHTHKGRGVGLSPLRFGRALTGIGVSKAHSGSEAQVLFTPRVVPSPDPTRRIHLWFWVLMTLVE